MKWFILDKQSQQRDFFFGSVVESVDTPDLKSVDHYGRASSSLATPIKINKIKHKCYVLYSIDEELLV